MSKPKHAIRINSKGNFEMELENKLLDENYISTRLNEIREIRKGEVRYEIVRSNREYSNTLYVYFLTMVAPNQWWRQNKVRISDHISKTTDIRSGKQFIVKPDQILNKKRKALLMRTFENSINDAIYACNCNAFAKISKHLNKGGGKLEWGEVQTRSQLPITVGTIYPSQLLSKRRKIICRYTRVFTRASSGIGQTATSITLAI